ncbi:hypothetical protein HYV50_04665 [Candidatus Pacearchaeota archaeon]|nr:hypothetical protein [Candidatus Pacearchaeota archaeon]
MEKIIEVAKIGLHNGESAQICCEEIDGGVALWIKPDAKKISRLHNDVRPQKA